MKVDKYIIITIRKIYQYLNLIHEDTKYNTHYPIFGHSYLRKYLHSSKMEQFSLKETIMTVIFIVFQKEGFTYPVLGYFRVLSKRDCDINTENYIVNPG